MFRVIENMNIKLAFLSLCFIFATVLTDEVVVKIPDGKIKGKQEVNLLGNPYYAFYSIRYAKPPVGLLRFQAPEPIEPWDDVYDATAERSFCYQVYLDYDGESEDCLFMNVFTPQNPSALNASLPVMFYIHGGGFIGGSGQISSPGGISPLFFMEHDVIFVSLNYRLGPFGFLSTGDNTIPGNAGLKDQLLALKWVQKNIASFGGDPNKVMIFGTSAGSASVAYHILSPASAGLFRAGIMESGTALCPWAYQRNQTEISFLTAGFINEEFKTERDSQKLWSFLQTTTGKEIDTASLNYAKWVSSQPYSAHVTQLEQGFYYAPVVEVENSNAFLTEYQYEAFANGYLNKVPVIMGISAEEGLANLDEWLNYTLMAYDADLTAMIPQDLHLQDANVKQVVANLIKEEYSPNSSFLDNTLGAIQFYTEQDFAKAIVKHADLQAPHSDVYFYEFTYQGKMGGNTVNHYPGSGNVTHSEECGYIFSGSNPEYYPLGDQKVHKRFMTLWVNFATDLNPTPNQDIVLENIIWPTVKSGNFQYLDIGADLIVRQGYPKANRIKFWNNIYETYGVRPFDSY